MKRVEANDAASICMLAYYNYKGINGFHQDRTKAMELYAKAADLGCSKAYSHLGNHYHEVGNLKKAKFHFEAAAMAGHGTARYNLGCLEYDSGNKERAVNHWTIAVSSGHYDAMHNLRISFDQGGVCRESIGSTLIAYNNSCAEVRSEAREALISEMI
jgi:TPR repeat protein